MNKENLIENILETLFWIYDTESKKTGECRLTFKNLIRGIISENEEEVLIKFKKTLGGF